MSGNIIEKLMIAVGFQTDEASRQKVTSEASALKGMLKTALGAVGITLTIAGVKNFIQETASIAAEVRSTNVQFNQTFGEMASTAKQSLREVSQETGIAEMRMKGSYARMASFAKTGGMDAAEANSFTARSMKALADNAAYMDKSIEYTQDVFQRLLKGNFTLDDNLNFNLAEAERNQMAMAMFKKKTYNDLTENEKKELILQKLIEANRQMGAEGQARREAGEYTNQAGELSDIAKQLKATIGMIFLPQVLTITSELVKLLTKVTNKLGDAEQKGTAAYEITQKLTKAVDVAVKIGEKGWDVLRKVYNAGKRAVDMVGGYENALKLLSVAIGTIVGYGLIGKVGGLISKIGGLSAVLGGVNLKLAGMVLLVTAVFLIFDDLIAFMQGRDSLLGDIIDAAGGDQQKVRDTLNGIKDSVEGFFDKAKEKLSDFGNDIRDAADGLAEFFGKKDAGDMLLNTLTNIKEMIKAIAGVAETAAGFIAFITGADDTLSGEKNVATSKGTERMSNADAKEYKQLTHDIKGTKGQERDRIQSQIDALEAKYHGTDTTTAGQKMMSNGYNRTWNSFDRVFGNGEHQSNSTFSDKMAASWNSFKHFVDDSTLNIFHDELFPPVSEASEDTKNANKDTRNSTFKAQDGMLSATQSAMMKIVDIISGAMAGLSNIDFSGLNAAGYALSGVGANMPVRSAAGKSGATIYQTNSFSNSFYGDTRDNQVAASKQLTKDSKDATAKMSGGLAAGR